MTPDLLASIHLAAFTETRAWGVSEFSALLDSRHVFVVGDSKGFAMGRVIADEAELLTLAVHPDLQGQGLGRALLLRFQEVASQRGATEVFLEVSEQNITAINLYTSNNYTESGRRKNYYALRNGTQADALILRRNLPK